MKDYTKLPFRRRAQKVLHHPLRRGSVLGARVRAIRLMMNMNQMEFGEFLGLHRGEISKIECGRRDLMWNEFVTLRKTTGCSITSDWSQGGVDEHST